MSGRTIIPIVIVTLVIAAAAAGAGYKARLNASGEPRANVSYANDADDTEEDSSAAERMITEEELRQTTEPSLQEAEPEVEPEEKPEPEEEPELSPTPLPKYDEYLEVNPYVAGWLSVDGSKIDGPVVYTPGSQNYYLHRALDGSDSERGTYFIAINWQEQFNHTLIYGHNMKDGTGFGSLLKFADSSYGSKNNIIHFDTLYEDRDYELLGVFYSQIQEDELETEEDRATADKLIEEGNIDLGADWGDTDIYREEKDQDNGRFRYYYYTDLEDKSDFDYYVANVRERSLYDTGVQAEWGDELLTLSTCSYQVKNGRFVVVAVHHRNADVQ